MQYPNRLIIVVRAEHRDRANALAAEVDTVGGLRAFIVPLYAAGQAQRAPTHYWCNWALTDREYRALLVRFGRDTMERPGLVYNAATWRPEDALDTLRLETKRVRA